MGRAVSRRKTRPSNALTIATEKSRADEEQHRAALGYLLWPAALYEYFAEREPASHWYRLQVRQALRFGLTWSAIGLAALLWPLVFSLLVGSMPATVAAYTLAIVVDIAVFVIWLRRAVGYSKRARRGETFNIGHYAA